MAASRITNTGAEFGSDGRLDWLDLSGGSFLVEILVRASSLSSTVSTVLSSRSSLVGAGWSSVLAVQIRGRGWSHLASVDFDWIESSGSGERIRRR